MTIAEADSAAASSDATLPVEAPVAAVSASDVTAKDEMEFNDDNAVMAQCPMSGVGARGLPVVASMRAPQDHGKVSRG
ncbi:hypothetical protein [Paraburkholderia unamae]|uniref:Uncharacterized protein n=1 Tax=Paraburkholderia unamae TaxID=219649 RepID=A0ACC6RLL3_9BURK